MRYLVSMFRAHLKGRFSFPWAPTLNCICASELYLWVCCLLDGLLGEGCVVLVSSLQLFSALSPNGIIAVFTCFFLCVCVRFIPPVGGEDGGGSGEGLPFGQDCLCAASWLLLGLVKR